jgi:hypothetical protein
VPGKYRPFGVVTEPSHVKFPEQRADRKDFYTEQAARGAHTPSQFSHHAADAANRIHRTTSLPHPWLMLLMGSIYTFVFFAPDYPTYKGILPAI